MSTAWKDLSAAERLVSSATRSSRRSRRCTCTTPWHRSDAAGRPENASRKAGCTRRSHRPRRPPGPAARARRDWRCSRWPTRRSSSSYGVSGSAQAETSARTSSARSRPRSALTDGLISHVGSKRLLSSRQLRNRRAAPTVAELLVGTPNAKILASSREPLNVDSERRYPVEPLGSDDAQRLRRARPQCRPAASPRSCRSASIHRLPLAIEPPPRVALLDLQISSRARPAPRPRPRSRDAPARQRQHERSPR